MQSIAFAYSTDLLPHELQRTEFGIFNVTLATGWGLAGFLIGGSVSDILIFLGASIAHAYRVSFLISSIIVILGMIALISIRRVSSSNQ